MHGLTVGDPAIVRLINAKEFHSIFPEGSEFIKVGTKQYAFTTSHPGNNLLSPSWAVVDSDTVAGRVFSRQELQQLFPSTIDASSWPSIPPLRAFADSTKPEYFIWDCFALAALVGLVVRNASINVLIDKNLENKTN